MKVKQIKLKRAFHSDVNAFVFGDLLIDHTAFVEKDKNDHPLRMGQEESYRVLRRIDTAGGAATSARAINVLTGGTVYLWGLIGYSPWGAFRSILEMSQITDNVNKRIELRAVHDESDAPMTTISRLVSSFDKSKGRVGFRRVSRFSDHGNIHIPEERKISALTHHLLRIHKIKTSLSVILLDDLDMGALRDETTKAILSFAKDNNIAVVIRGRRKAEKYAFLDANTLICTLPDWVQLVNSHHDAGYVEKNLMQRDVEYDILRLSRYNFKSIDNLIILIGDEWIKKVVTITYDDDDKLYSSISFYDDPHDIERSNSEQLGSSDVFAGAFAVALGESGKTAFDFTGAVEFARMYTYHYQFSGWHKMPHSDDLHQPTPDYNIIKKLITNKAVGARYLPTSKDLSLRDALTRIEGFYSVVSKVRDIIESLYQAVNTELRPEQPYEERSIVICAPGGSGKSMVAHQISEWLMNTKRICIDVTKLQIPWSWLNPTAIINSIHEHAKSDTYEEIVVIVDEALKYPGHGLIGDKGVMLLELAAQRRMRFVFIDANFRTIKDSHLDSQFNRRITWLDLPSALDRLYDAPYVIASGVKKAKNNKVSTVTIQETALVAVCEWLIEAKQNYGELLKAIKNLTELSGEDINVKITYDGLPEFIRAGRAPFSIESGREYTVKCDIS
jgi:hypothetical protein